MNIPSLNILAFDTALTSCSAAVIRDGVILSEIFEDRARGQAERLLPMCLEASAQAGLSFGDMDAVAVTRGPGTFTGVRIGLAAARGMALALGRPLVGITTLEITAANAVREAHDNFPGRIAICHDARRSEVYLQIFEVTAGRAIAASTPRAVPLAEVERYLDRGVRVMRGTAVEIVRPFLSQETLERLDFSTRLSEPNAGTLGRLAWDRLAAGKEVTEEVTPLYLRAPDAVAARAITYPFQNK